VPALFLRLDMSASFAMNFRVQGALRKSVRDARIRPLLRPSS
jgi:hypothetical protein